MIEVSASEAKIHLLRLLDDIERGESVAITRRGRRIARIVPDRDGRQDEIDSALAAIAGIRRRTGRVHVAELLSARNEGRQ